MDDYGCRVYKRANFILFFHYGSEEALDDAISMNDNPQSIIKLNEIKSDHQVGQ